MTVQGTDSSNLRGALPLLYKLTLADKILVATLLLILMVGVVGTAVFRTVLRGRLSEEAAASTAVLAAAAAQNASIHLHGGGRAELQRMVDDLQRLDESVAYALVLDRDGTVLAHTFSWDPPQEVIALSVGNDPAALGATDPRRVLLDGELFLDVTAPIVVDAAGAGELRLGTSLERVDRIAGELNLFILLFFACLMLMALVLARSFYRYVTRPVAELTRLADEVSTGNLDVSFDFGKPVRCWQIKNCHRTECAAYMNTSIQCWYVDGTPCEGYESRFPQKLVGCRTCEVYKAHKGDEIVQLADSFRHMTTNLKGFERSLRRALTFQGSLIHNSFDGIIATDERDMVRIFNRVAQRLTGLAEGEVVGKLGWEQLFATQMCDALESPLFQDGINVVFGFYRKELALHARDDSTVDVLASGITLHDGPREVGKVIFFKDMREIIALREELVRKGRLAATGQTVASISHSIKNILDGLRGGAYIYNRGQRVEDTNARAEGWSMVERNIDLISSLVADLLNYAKDREPDLQPCNPNDLISDVLTIMAPRAQAADVELETHLDPAAARAAMDDHAMHQCLSNLVTNAIDAARGSVGGWVRVCTSLTRQDELEILVQDSGPGIAPKVVDDLFSSMVSTKGSKGTGLGLLVVHKIVAEHGGVITVEPDQAPGATFRVVLPRGVTPEA